MNSRCKPTRIIRTFLLGLLISFQVLAVDVSGSISANTTWTAAASPYTVTGTIRIINSATLTIEPGVVVRFSPDTNLQVEQGTLLARGGVGAPIVLTSARDSTGGNPAPGDWGRLEFGPEATAQSELSRARVAYGRGIRLRGWSGRLDGLRIENNLGPAIDSDLQSFPSGSGLSAVGNLINGITIPSGIIRNQAHLALTGIPYVVQKGWLRVGGEAVFLNPNPLDLPPTATAQISLSIADPAPAGGRMATLTTTPAGRISIPATVQFASGETEKVFDVVAGATLGNVTIAANVPGVGNATGVVRVLDQPRIVWSGSPIVPVGRSQTLTLNLVPPAPTPRTITLSNSNPAVLTAPTSVMLSSTGTVTVTGVAAGEVNLLASSPDYQSGTQQLTVRPVSMNWPGVVVAPGAAVLIKVALSDPVPIEGASFSVTSSAPGVASVPATVTAPSGAQFVNVLVTGVSAGESELSISSPIYGTASTIASIQLIAVQFEEVNATIARGLTEPFWVRLSRPAPAGGVTIAVSSADPKIAGATPSSVFVPAGQTLSATPVDVSGIAEGQVNLTAAADGLESGALAVTVTSPVTVHWAQSSVQRLGLGMQSRLLAKLDLRSNGQPYSTRRARTINLQSSNANALGAAINQGFPGSSAYVRLDGLQITSEPAGLTAEVIGIGPSPTLQVSVVQPRLQVDSLNFNQTLVPASRNNLRLSLRVPGSEDTGQHTIQARSLALELQDRDPSNIVEGFFDSAVDGNQITAVTIPAGQFQAPAVYIGAPSVAGSYRVRAQSAGVESVTSSAVAVSDLELRFSMATSVVGKGLRSTTLRIQRYRNGTLLTDGITNIQLRTSDSTRLTIPGSVTISHGQSSSEIALVGVELSSGVEVTAQASGYRGTTALAQVIDPVVDFNALDGTRPIGTSRDGFNVSLRVPGAAAGQVANGPIQIGLDLVDVTPAGVVQAIHPAQTGSDTIANVTIPTGLATSPTAYVGAANVVGTYRLRATRVGNTNSPWLSATQTVVSNAVAFSAPAYRLSRGFESEVIVSLLQAVGAPGVPVNLRCEPAAHCSLDPVNVTLSAGGVPVRLRADSIGAAVLIAEPSISTISTGQANLQIVAPELKFSYGTSARSFVLQESNGGRPVSDLMIDLALSDINPPLDLEFLEQGLCDPNCAGVGLQTTTPFHAGRPTSGVTGFAQFDDYVNITAPTQGASWRVRASITGVGEWWSPPQLVIEEQYPIDIPTGMVVPVRARVVPPLSSSVTFTANCSNPACGDEGTHGNVIPAGGEVMLRVRGYGPEGPLLLRMEAPDLGPAEAPVEVGGRLSLRAIEPTELHVGDQYEILIEAQPYCPNNLQLEVAITNSAPDVVRVPSSVRLSPNTCSATVRLEALGDGDFVLEFRSPGIETLTWPEIEVQQLSLQAIEPTELHVGDEYEIQIEARPYCPNSLQLEVAITNSAPTVVRVPATVQLEPDTCSATVTLEALTVGAFVLEFRSPGAQTLTWPEIEVLP